MRFPKLYTIAGILCLLLVTTPNIQELTLLGKIDAISVSFLSLCLLLFPFSFSRGKIACFASACIAILFVAFNLLASIYFLVFQSYPLLDYWPVIKDSIDNLSIYIATLIIFILAIIILLVSIWMSKLSTITQRLQNTIFCCTFFAVFIFGQLSYKQLYSFNDTYTMRDTSASGFILRSSINSDFFYQDLETKNKNRLNTIINSIPPSGELPAAFHHSALLEFTGDISSKGYTFPFPDKFPLYKKPKEIFKTPTEENVILILLESVRASELGIYGAKYSASPNLDARAKFFSIFKNNYSTAPLTSKSEFAISCSTMDHFSGSPISSRELEIKKRCFPNILKDHGYDTYWLHGNNKEFYKRESFLTQLGIDNIVDKTNLIKKGYNSELGWGITDEELFDYTIDKLSNLPNKFYAEILTVSNHSPFNFDWGIDIPKNISYSDNQYFNSYRQGIYYTDYALNKFLDKFFSSELATNTHLIITGDHGAWAFADNTLSQITKDEQFFRMPLLIYSPNEQPKTINAMTSHIDIAPTVLDLLNIQAPNSFMGMSVYSDTDKLNKRTIYSFYDRIFSVRNNIETCVPLKACFASESCPKAKVTIKAEKSPSNMVCSTSVALENMKVSTTPTHLTSTSLINRTLLDYSQLSLTHPSDPLHSSLPYTMPKKTTNEITFQANKLLAQ